MQLGTVLKQEFEYTRHGTTTLTAGLDVVTGRIVSPTLEPTRTEPEFVQHLARTVNAEGVLVGSPSSHPFFYLPKHSSWLNQIEIIFGILHCQCLRCGNLTSVVDLEAKLREFMDYYNTTMAHPFAWTYTGKPTQQKRRPTFVSPHRRVQLSKSRRLAEPLASCSAV